MGNDEFGMNISDEERKALGITVFIGAVIGAVIVILIAVLLFLLVLLSTLGR